MEDLNAIGERAAKAIRERCKKNGTSLKEECEKLGFFSQCVERWETRGYAPSAYYLQKMYFAGFDVIYILTGEKDGTRKTGTSSRS